MTEIIKIVETLAARARLEVAPQAKVSHRVLYHLSQEDIPVDQIIRPFAVLTVVAAVVTLVLSIQLYEVLSNPLSGLFWLATEVMP